MMIKATEQQVNIYIYIYIYIYSPNSVYTYRVLAFFKVEEVIAGSGGVHVHSVYISFYT